MINAIMNLPTYGLVIIWIVAALIVLGGIGSFFFLLYVARRVFEGTLVRKEGEWGYSCSDPEDCEQMAMWNEGVLWAEENAEKMSEADITSFDGLHLHAEYYDFGGDSAVIFLPGRCECLRYSCYFAKPYADMGINILVIDTRCHGKSDGKYSTIGLLESRDVRSWCEYLERERGIKKVWLHAICLGGAAALKACVGEGAPENIKGIVAEGPYVTFRETYKQHLIQLKKPVWPLVDLIMMRIKRVTGADYRDVAPIRLCREYAKHILYIFGEEDVFSLPKKSRELFAATKSETKRIVWLPTGRHSHLRPNNKDAYDKAIREYITDVQ